MNFKFVLKTWFVLNISFILPPNFHESTKEKLNKNMKNSRTSGKITLRYWNKECGKVREKLRKLTMPSDKMFEKAINASSSWKILRNQIKKIDCIINVGEGWLKISQGIHCLKVLFFVPLTVSSNLPQPFSLRAFRFHVHSFLIYFLSVREKLKETLEVRISDVWFSQDWVSVVSYLFVLPIIVHQ